MYKIIYIIYNDIYVIYYETIYNKRYISYIYILGCSYRFGTKPEPFRKKKNFRVLGVIYYLLCKTNMNSTKIFHCVKVSCFFLKRDLKI